MSDALWFALVALGAVLVALGLALRDDHSALRDVLKSWPGIAVMAGLVLLFLWLLLTDSTRGGFELR